VNNENALFSEDENSLMFEYASFLKKNYNNIIKINALKIYMQRIINTVNLYLK
jgi:hypothetical protein